MTNPLQPSRGLTSVPAPSSSPQTCGAPSSWPARTCRPASSRRNWAPSFGRGHWTLFRFWGEGAGLFRPDRGSWNSGLCAPRREVPISDTGRGDIPRVGPGAPRRWRFAPGGPDVPSFSPAVGGARGRWPPAWMLPRACQRQLRSIDPRRPAPPPPPQRASPSNPHRSWAAPPAALSANTALVCARAPRLGVRGAQGRVCVPGAPGPRPLPCGPASAGPS